MILSDQSIAECLDAGHIVVNPTPSPDAVQPASLDVRIGPEIYDPVEDELSTPDEIVLEPAEFRLGTTAERISLPAGLAAMLAGRSTVGRKGVIVHATAGWLDPGFSGQVTLELLNISLERVTFEPYDRIAQFVFFQLDRPAVKPYAGQYQHQEGPTGPGDV